MEFDEHADWDTKSSTPVLKKGEINQFRNNWERFLSIHVFTMDFLAKPDRK